MSEEQNKAVIRRLVEEMINGGRLDVVDELCAPSMAAAARGWITPFRDAFPDVEMTVVELVAEDDRVATRLTCSATHLGQWEGHPPSGRRFNRVDEVYFFRFRPVESRTPGGWRTT